MNLEELVREAKQHQQQAEQVGELAVKVQWQAIEHAAVNLIDLYKRVSDQAGAKAARIASWKK